MIYQLVPISAIHARIAGALFSARFVNGAALSLTRDKPHCRTLVPLRFCPTGWHRLVSLWAELTRGSRQLPLGGLDVGIYPDGFPRHSKDNPAGPPGHGHH